jgi:hypothetical protein
MINKFKDVKDYRWLKRYLKFIETFKKDSICTFEVHKHHILPKAIYTEYKDLSIYSWNKAVLSYREHYIAHYMLAKALGGNMWFAFNRMNNSCKKINSLLYEIAIKNNAEQARMQNKGKLSVFDNFGNRFQVSTDDSRLGISIFPTRTGAIIDEKQKEKNRKTLKRICDNGKTLAENSYIKRNNTLSQKDENFLKNIGKKSSKTQKENELNKGINNPNANGRKIIVMNELGEIQIACYRFEIKDLSDNYPKRMIGWCLGNKKPMYTNNSPKGSEKFKLWYACYEDEIWCDINVYFRNRRKKKPKKENVRTNFTSIFEVFDENGVKFGECYNKELKRFCKDNNLRLNQFQYSYRQNKKILKGDHKGWSCIETKI